MSRSRSGSGQRVSSPAVTRRHLRSHDLHIAFSDDDPFNDPRLLGREASPRGLSRTSASAPSSVAGTPRTFNRRYSGHHGGHANVTNDIIIPVPDYISAYNSRSRESSPRTRVTPSVINYVNGDVNTSSLSRQSRHRHNSFPDYPSIPFPQSCPSSSSPSSSSPSSSLLPLHTARDPRRREPSPIPGVRQSPGAMARLQVNTHSEDQASISPPSSEEAAATSSVTREEEGGGGVMSGRGLEESMTSEEGAFCHYGLFSAPSWLGCLTCPLCEQLYRRPRILPCGHSFCTECLVQLKNEAAQETPKLPGNHATCLLTDVGRGRMQTRAWGGGGGQRKAGKEVGAGAQLVCPVPGCGHSLRLLNLGRWTVRNKAVSETVTAVRIALDNKRDACTQTDICQDSILVSIPRSLMRRRLPPGGAMEVGEEGRGLRRVNSSSTVMDRVVHRALSMDCLSRHYIPQPHVTWRSYLAMLGMTALDQVLH